ncbi:bleomycin resistance family protein [Pseudomonas sp. C1C7]|uniref:VOC family protein n=1 Tax=Pseudomonas sp. C1C7 TaxID=2735272 RepID=UPI0015863034|nr:VOC family protein [Pseudomonas sp. C1C7]NUT77793.1 bleomycin resistance family protein [Pseudomonas sp. C1C7]
MALTLLLRCSDLDGTRRYYRDTLGFTVFDSAQSTLTVVLEDCRITFTQQDLWGTAMACSGTIYCAISEVDRYYDSVKDKVEIAWPLQDMPYGSREFGVRDCNGYYLAFAQLSAVG